MRLEEVIAGDGAVRVEKLVGDVGEDGGAAGGDGALGDELEEPGEELTDVYASGELGEFGEELGGEVFRAAMGLLGGAGVALTVMVRAKTEVGVRLEPDSRPRLPLEKRYWQRSESLLADTVTGSG